MGALGCSLPDSSLLQCLILSLDSLSLLATPWPFSGLVQSPRLPEVQLWWPDSFLVPADPCSPNILVSSCPDAQLLGIRQWESSRDVPFRDFSLDVALRPEKSSGAFHLAQEKIAKIQKSGCEWNLAAKTLEGSMKEDIPHLCYFTLTPGRQGLFWKLPSSPSCPQALLAEV